MTTYKIIEERAFSEDLGEYNTYGLRGTSPDDNVVIRDISTSRIKVEDFVRRLEEGQLSLLHIHEVVEDFLS